MGSVLRINIICSSLSIHENECHATVLIEWKNENMQDNQNPSKKISKLFAKYQRSCTQNVSQPFSTMSVWAQTNNYLQEVDELASFPSNTFQYRTYKLTNHPVLFALAQKYFVCLLRLLQWSTFLMKIGLIIRSHRGKLSSDMLSIIVYLKRNANMQK